MLKDTRVFITPYITPQMTVEQARGIEDHPMRKLIAESLRAEARDILSRAKEAATESERT